ncbi:MAG TPA: hypothetical protein VEK73_01505 [Xanthobacteraceae bacterium]|nr:hypothetical protein [Xanthobacteraceae bacterium]
MPRIEAAIAIIFLIPPICAHAQALAMNCDGHQIKQEKFVCQRVIAGQDANFEGQQEYGSELTDERRILTPKFLKVLLSAPRIPDHGVRIIGARFKEAINLENAVLQRELWIYKSLLEQGANLSGLTAPYLISFDGSTIRGLLNLSGIQATGDLSIARATTPEHTVYLGGGTYIRGNLNLKGSKIKTINMDDIHVDGNLIMGDGNFNEVALKGAQIKGDLDLSKSTITDAAGIRMDGIHVDGNLNMGSGNFTAIDLKSAQIKGDLDLSKSTFNGGLNLTGARIDDLLLVGIVPKGPTTVFTNLSFSKANFGPGPILMLKMLSQQPQDLGFSSQNYATLAKSYSDLGLPDTARQILIEKETAEFKHSDFWNRIWLWFIWLFAGYGYRPEVTLAWIVGFVLVGAFIFKTGEDRLVAGRPPSSWLIFALDSVIPGIHLNKDHDDVAFAGGRQYFLYFLRFLGAVVIFVVLALLKRTLFEAS